MDDGRRMRRWRALALLASGLVLGVMLGATPAGSHVGGTIAHLWSHLQPKADKRYVKRCKKGSIAMVARFYDSGTIPSDGTFVQPNRYGGESWFACNGGRVMLQRLGSTDGAYRFKVQPRIGGTSDYYLASAAADSYSGVPLDTSVSGPFSGNVYDLHVTNQSGAAANPYYFTVMLIAAR